MSKAKTTEENKQFDETVLAQIKAGVTKAGKIEHALGAEMRAVDRSLQRLRKRGLIKHERGAWVVAS